jgi:glyoxylase-like metal-dependent hydrolase (beta-lactamase superfamily II)
MTYQGHVSPGGRPACRMLPGLTIGKLSVGSMDNNAYLLRCTTTGEALLIDAAAEPVRLIDWIGDAPVGTVVTTHRHGDHWHALADVVTATGAETVAGVDDARAIPVSTDRAVKHGDRVGFGEVELSVIALRGHTPGGIALLYDDPAGRAHLFTGDSLFPGGPGKTSDPAAFTSLMDDLQKRVFDVLDDDTWVYPGHGDDTTLGAERPQLGEWRARGW